MLAFGTVTVIALYVKEVGVRLVPPNETVVACAKPEPLIVSVNEPELTVVDAGDKLVMVGTASTTPKFALIVPPPGPEFVTLTGMFPAV